MITDIMTMAQVLDSIAQFGRIADQFDASHCLFAAPAISLHCDLRVARNASVRREVRLDQEGKASTQLRHFLAITTHCIPGTNLCKCIHKSFECR